MGNLSIPGSMLRSDCPAWGFTRRKMLGDKAGFFGNIVLYSKGLWKVLRLVLLIAEVEASLGSRDFMACMHYKLDSNH